MTAQHGEQPPVEFEAVVTMRDDVGVSLTVQLPGEARAGLVEVPVILDCHPYRKDDLFSFRGAGLYEYFVERGFGTARLDVRGTGRSQGSVPAAEYSAAEITDCVEVIEWLAAQPWCNGSVGMWGISWSAINTLLVAARRPPALRACIAVHPSDELFASDIHYIDGLFHYDLYELSIDLLNGITPGPEFPLDEQILIDRFDQPPWLATVLTHQTRDSYWRDRSLNPWYDRIGCPVFLVGGWYDGYHECVFRLLDQLSVPVQACVGPWTHVLPHMGGPGEPVDWLAQAAAWWDRWLRSDPDADELAEDHGRQVTLFQRDWHPPAGPDIAVTGRWRSTTVWPPPGMTPARLTLTKGQLLSADSPPGWPNGRDAAADTDGRPEPLRTITIESAPHIGHEVGHWWGDVAADQAPLDARCVVFDSAALPVTLDLLGAPELLLWVDPSPGTHLFARLEDVAPDGRVTLVTGAGTAVPDQGDGPVELRLPLHWTSWRFPATHRVRIALSTALWPMFWPAKHTAPLRIRLSGDDPSVLTLPIPPDDWGTASGPSPVPAAQPSPRPRARPEPVWELDQSAEAARFTWATTSATQLGFATMTSSQRLEFEVSAGPVVDASAAGLASIDVELPDRTLRWQVRSSLSSRGERYKFTFCRQLSKDGAVVRERFWEYGIPRLR